MLPPFLADHQLDEIIRRGLDEDVGDGDVTTMATVGETVTARGVFRAKESGVLAGIAVADRVFAAVDPELRTTWTATDGDHVEAGAVFGRIDGSVRGLLTGERLALNVLQRMSGIATATRRMVDAVAGLDVRILDTRKTAPGLRLLDKWAVGLGGGRNHRIGLFDMILIKDNHIAAAGGVTAAIKAATAFRPRTGRELLIEVEAATLEQVQEVLDAGGVDYILLDNMVGRYTDGSIDTSRLASAVRRVGGRIATEASGNVTLETVRAIAETGVDNISCGALTHSVQALDISLKIDLESVS
jgi:nicotinate-nucleotide pyrophosphorylase (carboxylating)